MEEEDEFKPFDGEDTTIEVKDVSFERPFDAMTDRELRDAVLEDVLTLGNLTEGSDESVTRLETMKRDSIQRCFDLTDKARTVGVELSVRTFDARPPAQGRDWSLDVSQRAPSGDLVVSFSIDSSGKIERFQKGDGTFEDLDDEQKELVKRVFSDYVPTFLMSAHVDSQLASYRNAAARKRTGIVTDEIKDQYRDMLRKGIKKAPKFVGGVLLVLLLEELWNRKKRVLGSAANVPGEPGPNRALTPADASSALQVLGHLVEEGHQALVDQLVLLEDLSSVACDASDVMFDQQTLDAAVDEVYLRATNGYLVFDEGAARAVYQQMSTLKVRGQPLTFRISMSATSELIYQLLNMYVPSSS